MLLAIDIGNTNLHVGFFRGGEDVPFCHFCLGSDEKRSCDEYAFLLSAMSEQRGVGLHAVTAVIIGSVVPTLTGTVRAAVRTRIDAPVTVVGPGVRTGFPIRLSDPSELGADLAANAAGAVAVCGAPCVIVSIGTATVVSAMDKSGAFAGASILPGVRMSYGALGETGLLKSVASDAKLPTVGKDTEEAIRSGVLYGTAYAVKGLAMQYLPALGLPESTPVIVSGSAAEELIPLLPATYTHIPLLTLRGLARIHAIGGKR